MVTKEDCSCNECKNACCNRPGWFLPGEPEKVAAYLGIPLEQLFKEKLMVDWWWLENGSDTIYLLAPGVDTGKPGEEYPVFPQGMCRFYDADKGLCTIHPVKPYECREFMHGDTKEEADRRHEQVAMVWLEPKNKSKSMKQIRKLLGREPQARQPSKEDIAKMYSMIMMQNYAMKKKNREEFK